MGGGVLGECGREPTGRPHQMRTWNLSSIWTIPTDAGRVWLKSVPPFFAHEGAIIEWLAEPVVPPLLGWDAGRVLMADIAGTDQYDASLATLQRAVERLVSIQARVSGRLDELRAIGLADWRWSALRPLIDDVVDRHRRELDRGRQRALERLIGALDARCADIDACGLPMTLVHGDFHPGNLRGDDANPFILDWGDCGVGHPLFDVTAMMERLDTERRTSLMSTWARKWREHRPASDPLRAATLIEPVAALRQAVIYRGFLDGIEPSEHCFHAADPARWLRRAARAESAEP
jgi:Ser/Thr protein kinase RdoA (MazF antagonist)